MNAVSKTGIPLRDKHDYRSDCLHPIAFWQQTYLSIRLLQDLLTDQYLLFNLPTCIPKTLIIHFPANIPDMAFLGAGDPWCFHHLDFFILWLNVASPIIIHGLISPQIPLRTTNKTAGLSLVMFCKMISDHIQGIKEFLRPFELKP